LSGEHMVKITPHYNANWAGYDRPMLPTERRQLCHGCGDVFVTSLPIDKCERCSPRVNRQVVSWTFKDEVVEWKATRMPALGWNALTLLEALADSAAHTLASNPDAAKRRLNDILRILRLNVEKEKSRVGRGLLKRRCPFRETTRTRCNRYPVLEDGYCALHQQDKRQKR